MTTAASSKLLDQFKLKSLVEQREALIKTLTPIQNDAPVYLRMLNIVNDPTADSIKLVKVMEILMDAIDKYTVSKKDTAKQAAEIQHEKSHQFIEKLHEMELKERENEDIDSLLDNI